MSMGAIWASVLVVHSLDTLRRGASAVQESNEIDGSPISVVVFCGRLTISAGAQLTNTPDFPGLFVG